MKCKSRLLYINYVFDNNDTVAALSKSYLTVIGILISSFRLIWQFEHAQINDNRYPLQINVRSDGLLIRKI